MKSSKLRLCQRWCQQGHPGRSHHSLNAMSSAHPLQVLKCKPLSCTSAAVTWKAPENLGHPPMHKYKLERQLLAKGAQQTAQGWVTADGDVDHEAHSVVDANVKVRGPVAGPAAWLQLSLSKSLALLVLQAKLSGSQACKAALSLELLPWPCLQAGIYRYRLTAWNAHSWSQYAISEPCSTAQARLPCADAATCRHLGRDCPEAAEQAAATVPSAKVRWSGRWQGPGGVLGS